MKILDFTDEYLDDMSQLFMEVYTEPGYEWDMETAKKYLERDYKYFPEYCFVAVDDYDECMGAVFCSIDPYYKGKLLFIDSMQVKEKFRRQGVGKSLLKKVIETARDNGVSGVHFLADARIDYPKEWYERLGFETTGWTEYEAEIDNIRI